MLLGIAGHAEVKASAGVLDGCAVGKETFVEPLHLTDEVRRVGMSAGRRCEATVLFRLVAAQQQQVVDAKELQVEQFVLNVLNGGTATDDVRLHGNVVALLDGSSDGDGAGTTAHAAALELTALQLAVDIFRVVGRDVDESGLQRCQFVDVGKQFRCTRSFQWRQHFERELPAPCIFFDKLCYAHISLQRYVFLRSKGSKRR